MLVAITSWVTGRFVSGCIRFNMFPLLKPMVEIGNVRSHLFQVYASKALTKSYTIRTDAIEVRTGTLIYPSKEIIHKEVVPLFGSSCKKRGRKRVVSSLRGVCATHVCF